MTAIEDHHLPDILPAPRDKPDELDKLARELADKIRWEIGVNHSAVTAAVKTGILEGMKLQRERDAVIAEKSSHFSRGMLKSNPDDVAWRVEVRTSEEIAAAIRSAL